MSYRPTRVITSRLLENVGLSVTANGTTLTISLKQANGTSALTTGLGAAKVSFRSSTAATGGFRIATLTASPTDLVLTSGSSLGLTAGMNQYIWVYLIDTDGTDVNVQLGACGDVLDDFSLQSSTAEGGAGGATTFGTLYSVSGVSGKPVRIIGRIKINEASFGDGWDSAPSEVSINPPVIVTTTDWVSYTPTIATGGGSISATITGRWRRQGDTMEVQVAYDYTSGTGDAADFTLSLPSGYTFDGGKLASGSQVTGGGFYFTTAGGFKATSPRAASSTALKFSKDSIAGHLQGTDADEAGGAIHFEALAPITGWTRYGA